MDEILYIDNNDDENHNRWLQIYYAAIIDRVLISEMCFSPDFGTLRPVTRERFNQAVYINEDSPDEFQKGYNRSIIAVSPGDKTAIIQAFEHFF